PRQLELRHDSQTAVTRPEDRESIRAVLADVEPAGETRRLAGAPSRACEADPDSRSAQMGDSRQARSGEHQRASAVSRAGWTEPMAHAVLLAQAEIAKDRERM